jgi:flavin-dependent thymidylate synthase
MTGQQTINRGTEMSNVRLIDYTGSGQRDPARYAAELLVYTKLTRLGHGAHIQGQVAAMLDVEFSEQLAYVANSVRTSWEFISYTFEITGVTRAFANQMTRTRYGVSFAQEAQRVADKSNFDSIMPETVRLADMEDAWHEQMKATAQTYRAFKRAGVPNQDCRSVLPMNTVTSLIARFDLRALADLVGKRDNLRAQGEYAEVARQMKAAVLEAHPWAGQFLSPDRLATPALDALLARELGDGSPVDKPALNEALKELDKLKGIW